MFTDSLHPAWLAIKLAFIVLALTLTIAVNVGWL